MAKAGMVAPVLTVEDIERARVFYQEKLGLDYKETVLGGEIALSSNGSELLLMEVGDKQPNEHTTATFEVKDLDKRMQELRNKGIKFEEYDTPEVKTQNGICEMGNERAAWFKDTEGNILCLHEKK
jgi:predicted enzyme related to lactoylglutathione lyase